MADQSLVPQDELTKIKHAITHADSNPALSEGLFDFFQYCENHPEVSEAEGERMILVAKDAIVKGFEIGKATNFSQVDTEMFNGIIDSVILLERERETHVLIPALARDPLIRDLLATNIYQVRKLFEAINNYYNSKDLQAHGSGPAMGEMLELYAEALKPHFETGVVDVEFIAHPIHHFKDLLTDKVRETLGDCALITATAFRGVVCADYVDHRQRDREYRDLGIPRGLEEFVTTADRRVSDSVGLQDHLNELLHKGADILPYARESERQFVARDLCDAFVYMIEIGWRSGEIHFPFIDKDALKRFAAALPPELRATPTMMLGGRGEGAAGAGFDTLDND